ncbi:MAG: pilus assembly protein N-terminal domain-containing protein [bacterium]
MILFLFSRIIIKNLFKKIQPKIKKKSFQKSESYSGSSATLRGGISELVAFVGKSQLIRFDEPIKRLSITSPALADIILLSPQEMLLNGKSTGVTSLIIWGETGDPVFFDLNVKNDPALVLNAIKSITPNENLNLKFMGNSIILSGKVSSILKTNKIKSLVEAYGFKLVDLAESLTPQVVLEIKVAEASRSFTKGFSGNYGYSDMASSFPGNFNIQNTNPLEPGYGGTFSGSSSGIQFFVHRPNDKPYLSISSVYTAAESRGLIKTLAEPKLVAAHGSSASFNAGKELPVPSGTTENGSVTFEYKNVGVNVEFKPIVLEETNRILLDISPEVSEPDSSTALGQVGGISIYGFKTRKAKTTVELNDGQTLVIAGLLQRSDASNKTLIPIMGDIPIIGKLFSSNNFNKGETELVIFVTPRIIMPNSIKENGV